MNGITPLRGSRLSLANETLAFERDHQEDIRAYWAKAIAANPRLWNGPFYMFQNTEVRDGLLHGVGFPTDFATFLYWRDNGRDRSLVHVTGTSLPVLSDGSLLAVRMSAHTANAGQIYFPAGSLDPMDIISGQFDLTLNICRELEEETGVVPSQDGFDQLFLGAFFDQAWLVARRGRLPFDFAEASDRINRHQAKTGDDELSGFVAIRSPDDAAQLKPYARALALWHFEHPEF